MAFGTKSKVAAQPVSVINKLKAESESRKITAQVNRENAQALSRQIAVLNEDAAVKDAHSAVIAKAAALLEEAGVSI